MIVSCAVPGWRSRFARLTMTNQSAPRSCNVQRLLGVSIEIQTVLGDFLDSRWRGAAKLGRKRPGCRVGGRIELALEQRNASS
jgi:hypothetical protein